MYPIHNRQRTDHWLSHWWDCLDEEDQGFQSFASNEDLLMQIDVVLEMAPDCTIDQEHDPPLISAPQYAHESGYPSRRQQTDHQSPQVSLLSI